MFAASLVLRKYANKAKIIVH